MSSQQSNDDLSPDGSEQGEARGTALGQHPESVNIPVLVVAVFRLPTSPTPLLHFGADVAYERQGHRLSSWGRPHARGRQQ